MENKLNELLDFLAKDEEEAIKGYDDVIAQLKPEDTIVAQLKRIRDEEEAHLKFLREAKENPNLEYVDPNEEEEASKLFKIDFKEKKL